jgi:hypothetical protein
LVLVLSENDCILAPKQSRDCFVETDVDVRQAEALCERRMRLHEFHQVALI